MPEIRELENFEDFEDAIHNGPTKDCFKTLFCLLMFHKLCRPEKNSILKIRKFKIVMLYTPECGICKRYKKKMAKKWSEDPEYKEITFIQGNGSKLRSLAVSFN